MQASVDEKKKLIEEIEECRRIMENLKEQLKIKDELLYRFEERKTTIDILVHKIKVLGAQMNKEKDKMERSHREEVEKYEREVHSLMNVISTLKVSNYKQAVPFDTDKALTLRRPSHADKQDLELQFRHRILSGDLSRSEKRPLVKMIPAMSSTRSQLLSRKNSGFRGSSSPAVKNKETFLSTDHPMRMANLLRRRSKPNFQAIYQPV